MCDHHAGEQIKREQRHLVAAGGDQPAEHAGDEAVTPGRSRERARKQPRGERQITKAQHLADVLDARGRRAAERKRQRRHQRPADVPAAVAKEEDDPETAEE